MQVIVSAVAGEIRDGNGDELCRDLADGLCDDAIFSDYFHDEDFAKFVYGGNLRFSYDPNEGELYVITVYEAEHPLTEDQLQRLGDYTQGQWSDGVGEGFEQFPNYVIRDGQEYEVYASAWYRGQEVRVRQFDV